MRKGNDDPAIAKAVFSAELYSHRSLGRRGFRILLALTGLVCALQVLFFFITGAWPIGFFCGLDFLLLYIAFRANYRSARMREEVTISTTDVAIRKIAPSGRISEHHYNPFWTRFQVRRHQELGILSMHVSGEGRRTEIGAFLNPEDRESFANAFQGALATVKRGI
ncbi:DUF2244 domain-containing protein [Oryzifoliimicrobium ureilyticus]|uniref:DUF2244 domain-containing protein n=1 Tax=Oryzifoliimicrobium ureilyticus TaxID=3113724 RepID=UPI0030764FA3